MHMEAPVHTPEVESPLHEPEHIRLRGMVKFVVWFVVVLIVVHIFIYAVYQLYQGEARAQTNEITGLSEARIAPREPRLQPSIERNNVPRLDLDQMRRRDIEEFKRRGWIVDEKTGEVRVPDKVIQQITALTAQPATRSAR